MQHPIPFLAWKIVQNHKLLHHSIHPCSVMCFLLFLFDVCLPVNRNFGPFHLYILSLYPAAHAIRLAGFCSENQPAHSDQHRNALATGSTYLISMNVIIASCKFHAIKVLYKYTLATANTAKRFCYTTRYRARACV